VVVTTPQAAAQEVAVRAAEMAQRTGGRVIGVIENMAGEIFGTGGGAELAEQVGVPLLGSIALDPRLRECADLGEPLVTVDPEAESSRVIAGIAAALASTRRGIRKQLPVVA
jgi:ATP-binding protein involved in chromosome partitioning